MKIIEVNILITIIIIFDHFRELSYRSINYVVNNNQKV